MNNNLLLKTCDACGATFPPVHDPVITEANEYLSSHSGNHVASEEDVPRVKGFIGIGQEQFAAYGNEIERITRIREELEARRHALSQMTARLSEMVRPSIRVLPVELLLNIFLLVCEDEFSSAEITRRLRRHPAVNLGLVCSQWRAITHTESQLWTRIHSSHIYFDGQDVVESSVKARAFRQITRFYLDKSRTLPLHIFLETDRVAHLESAFLELVSEAHRWREVSMSCASDFGVFPDNLPILEVMDIDEIEEMDGFPDAISTPNLHTLILDATARLDHPRVDTRSLKHLVLHGGIQYSHFSNLVRQSPMLSSLRLTNFFDFDHWPAVVSTKLTSLTIVNPSLQYHNLAPFFETIAVPLLTDLTISRSPQGSSSSKHLISFDNHCTSALGHLIKDCPLTSLTLRAIRFHDLHLLFDILSSLSGTLSRLTIFMCSPLDGAWDEFMERMARPQAYLTKLEDLEFSYHQWSERSESLLFVMVESRRRRTTPAAETGEQPYFRMSKLRITCKPNDGHLVARITSNMEQFSREGLQVHIYTLNSNPPTTRSF